MRNFKKLGCALMAMVMVAGLAGCGSSNGSGSTAGTGTDTQVEGNGLSELALITDVGTIDDKSFNQGAWEGLVAYGKDNNLTATYYKPAEKSDDAYLASVDLAVKGGAKVIVCPGYLFEVAVYKAQTKYPDVKFIILDGEPNDGEDPAKYSIAENTISIFYAEEQAGFLAGYAAVQDGYKNLGFMGGIAVPAVVRYGYGFVEGADYAAKELNVSDISIKYTYVGNFEASPENMAKASSWYNDGVEVIFACGGPVGNSVMKAAETAGGKVIGVDVDQYSESETVITSAMKGLASSVYEAVDSYYKDAFKGGVSVTLTAADGGVELPMANSRFETFTQELYDDIFAQLSAGSITLTKDEDVEDVSKIETSIVTVDLVK